MVSVNARRLAGRATLSIVTAVLLAVAVLSARRARARRSCSRRHKLFFAAVIAALVTREFQHVFCSIGYSTTIDLPLSLDVLFEVVPSILLGGAYMIVLAIWGSLWEGTSASGRRAYDIISSFWTALLCGLTTILFVVDLSVSAPRGLLGTDTSDSAAEQLMRIVGFSPFIPAFAFWLMCMYVAWSQGSGFSSENHLTDPAVLRFVAKASIFCTLLMLAKTALCVAVLFVENLEHFTAWSAVHYGGCELVATWLMLAAVNKACLARWSTPGDGVALLSQDSSVSSAYISYMTTVSQPPQVTPPVSPQHSLLRPT